ncbi:MAG TPA: SagB/ThcOx family dehydrogenase [Magnetospirillaceae bacterium]|nr:SagB/ThcOx family dehydrogenase [Magnetospirillaceae bacterium]
MSESYADGRKMLKSNWNLLDDPWKSDQSKGVPTPAQEEGPMPGERIVPLIPSQDLVPRGGCLLDLLRTRKSRRKYGTGPLTLEEFSFLCWSAAGIKGHRPKYSFRTYPSGGARHPLDLFAFVVRVEGLESGLYRYLPVEHALAQVRTGHDARKLGEALCGQDWNPAVVFVWAAVPYRTEWRYGPVSHKIIALDAGHACQNLYLACEVIGAGTCAIGAYDQDKLDACLGLDGKDRFALYAAPVGRAIAE